MPRVIYELRNNHDEIVETDYADVERKDARISEIIADQREFNDMLVNHNDSLHFRFEEV